jgi:NTE family protein
MHPEKDLEEFWLEIAESTPAFIPNLFTLDYHANNMLMFQKTSSASVNAAFFGVPKIFVPRWSWSWSSAWP